MNYMYDARGNGDGKIAPTITGDHENRITDYTAICVEDEDDMKTFAMKEDSENHCLWDGTQIAPTLTANNAGGSQRMPDKENFNAVLQRVNGSRKYSIRRLTPLECCRLQGFPDWWTEGVDGSDTAIYKMWGNGIALPCAVDVLDRIVNAVKEEEEGRVGNQDD